MQLRVDSDLLAQSREAPQDYNRRFTFLRDIERFVESNLFRRAVTRAIQERAKLLTAEYGEVF